MSKPKQTPSPQVDQKKLLDDKVKKAEPMVLKMIMFVESLQMVRMDSRFFKNRKAGLLRPAHLKLLNYVKPDRRLTGSPL